MPHSLYFSSGSIWTPSQASFNPTKMLEGRAHSCAHQAKEGDGAQGASALLAGFSGVLAIHVKDSPYKPETICG